MLLIRSIDHEAAKNRLKEIMSFNRKDKRGGSFKDDSLPKILLDIANYEYRDLVQNSLLLLDRYYSRESSIFHKASTIQLLKTTESNDLYDKITKEVLPVLPHYFEAAADDEEQSPIKELAQRCWLKGEVEGFEPHQINQNIILSFGNDAVHADRILEVRLFFFSFFFRYLFRCIEICSTSLQNSYRKYQHS